MAVSAIRPTILVTSAGGKTGMPVALQLLERGFPVRAFLRREDARARRLRDAGASIFIGDQYSVQDMRAAMRGVQRAYHCAPMAANGLHFGAIFAVAAREARLEHVVILSQWLSDPQHGALATREVWLNEQLLSVLPDTTVTVNNVGWFADNYFLVLDVMAQLGVMPMPLGDGSVAKDAPPSNEDIAAVSAAALADPSTHAGKVYRPTGPSLISPDEIAASVGSALGRPVRYEAISDAMFFKAMQATGRPVFAQTQLGYYVEEYRRGTFAVGAPSGVLPAVVGREAEDFATIARRYVRTRPEAVRTLTTRLSAAWGMLRILATPPLRAERVERERDHVLLRDGALAIDLERWQSSHARVSP